jgi:bifunctional non-homologous end joining protein LigD
MADPFNHPDWIFEIKWDRFRCLAFIDNGRCRLVSRKGNEFKSFRALNVALPQECRVGSVVLDGEIVCLGEDGENLCNLPLTDRKHRLRVVIPPFGERLLYCDHVENAGQELFDFVCTRDLEGIVAKRKFDPYLLDGTATWLKIRNKGYSQWAGREELFERERSHDPGCDSWNTCALVCEEMIEADAF